jgi:ABC-type sugar transport system permease subunit
MWRRFERLGGERGVLLLFVLPGLFMLLAAQFYPLAWSFWVSLLDWSLARGPEPRGFAGLANYAHAFSDPIMLGSIRTTVLLALGTTAVQMVAGFALAWLTVGETRLLRLSRTLLILPMVIAPIAAGTMWRMLLSARVGFINRGLALIGIGGPDWLGNPVLALISLVFIDAWEWIPFVTIIYAAALASLPTEPIAAAAVDGATPWQSFRYVVLPMLLPVTVLVLMFRLIDALLTLDVVFTTTFGGPGFSTYTVGFWIYQQGLRYFNISYAAACSWLLLLACLLIAGGLLAWRRHIVREQLA